MTQNGDAANVAGAAPAVRARLNYPVREAAILLGLSLSSTQRRIRAGRLQARQDGKRVVVPHEAIEAYRQSLPPATAARA